MTSGKSTTSESTTSRAREAVIVGAVRTPVGRRGGILGGWHPVDLLGQTLRHLVDRAGVDPALLDDVITGCVLQHENNLATWADMPCWLRVSPSRCPR